MASPDDPIVPLLRYGKKELPIVWAHVSLPGCGHANEGMLIDTGSERTILAKSLWGTFHRKPKASGYPKKLRGIGGAAHMFPTSDVEISFQTEDGGGIMLHMDEVYLNDDDNLKISVLGKDLLQMFDATLVLDYADEGDWFVCFSKYTLKQ